MSKIEPPKLPLRFFRWYCHPDYLEDLEGDLLERYKCKVKEKSIGSAKRGLIKDVIKLCRPGIIKPLGSRYHLNHYDMLKNHLKVAYRNLVRDRAFSTLNILGLTIGITASVIIFRYVDFERSYDSSHTKANRIYRLVADMHKGEVLKTTLTNPPLGPELKDNLSEVIDFTRLILPWSGLAASSTLSWQNHEDDMIKQSFQWGIYTDPGFFRLFSFPMIRGDRKTALSGVNKIVLSESSARKIFGNNWEKNENIIGQTLEYVNEFDRFNLTITGIIEDAPENSHFQYDFLASFSTLSTGFGKDYAETWNGNPVYTYLELSEGSNISKLEAKVQDYFLKNQSSSNISFALQPLRDIYLNSKRAEELKVNGNATYLSLLSLIAIAIFLIALINYVNLTTAKALKRGHEVGVRKVLGAFRVELMKQFLMESAFINGIAVILSLALLLSVSPSMDLLTGKPINYLSLESWRFLIFIFPISILLSGIYPAVVLSGYQPLKTLRGKLTYSKSGVYVRKYLVVFQFWMSIGLITFTFTVYKQLNYMRHSDKGFQKEGVLVVNGPINRDKTWIEHDQLKADRDNTDVFKNQLIEYPGVTAASLSWSIPGEKSSLWYVELSSEYSNAKFDVIDADNDYADVYDIKILAGEFNTQGGVVINEQAANVLGLKNLTEAIGDEFADARGRSHKINGIMKDYHHHSLNEPIRPIMFQENDPSYKLDSYYSLRLTSSNLQDKLISIESAYKKAYPDNPFDYYFIDDYFDAQYESDIRFGKLFAIFTMLTIFIAVLGLVGLALYTVSIRAKEIGIRKVLGASVKSIVALLNKNTLLLMGLSCILALPLAYWAAESWLSNYAFRIKVGWWFLMPVVLVPVIVFFTISILSYRAANLDPVETLKDE